jgi:uncharacterized protein (TIGR02271 family)
MPTERTIIAVFRNSSEADAAATDVEAAGISRDNIYLENGSDKSSRSRSKGTSAEAGFIGWLRSFFAEDDDPDRSQYEAAVKQGNCLLRIDAHEEEIPVVENVLDRHSPVDVHAEEPTAFGGKGTTKAIPVVNEDIQVGKRQVLRGGVRVYSRVVEQPIEENVRLREERVRVERQPVNRAATEADLAAEREQVVEVQEFAEEPVIAKQARVVEEVHVGKDVSERTETVRDTVRRTEVDVERSPGSRGAEFDDSDFRSDFQKRFANAGDSYDTYLPAYRYGYDVASDPRCEGRSFEEIEPDLRADYSRRYPNSTWEKMKDAIRYGWNKVTGKATATVR